MHPKHQTHQPPVPNETASDQSWHIRPFSMGDEKRIAKLFEEVYGRPRSVTHYRWKLVEALTSTDLSLIWLADTGTRLVGHYAGIPLRFRLDSQEFVVIHGCEAMTAPDFRNQGIFSALGTMAHESWTEAGIPFLIGLPNNQWGTRREYLGYQSQFSAFWYWKPISLDRLSFAKNIPVGIINKVWHKYWVSKLDKRTAGQNISVQEITQIGPEFDTLWDTYKDSYEAQVVRDRRWVEYRYGQVPGVDYRLVFASKEGFPTGYLVFRITGETDRSTAWIVDLFTGPEDQASRLALLSWAVHTLFKERINTIRILLSDQSFLVDEFRKTGFFRKREGFEVSVVPLALEVIPPALRHAKRWFTMVGDYDIF